MSPDTITQYLIYMYICTVLDELRQKPHNTIHVLLISRMTIVLCFISAILHRHPQPGLLIVLPARH